MTRRPAAPVLSLTWLRRHGACESGVRFVRDLFGPRPRRLSRRMLEQLLESRLTFFWWLVDWLTHRRPALQATRRAIDAQWEQWRFGVKMVNTMGRTHGQPLPQDVWVAALETIDAKRRRATIDAIAEYFNLR